MSAPTQMQPRCAIIGGSGAVGRLLGAALAKSGAQVSLVDMAAPAGGDICGKFVEGDITRASPGVRAELEGADVVVLALPEAAALAALPIVLRAVRPGALLVETLSVKSRMAAAVRAASPSIEVVGINPMFAPPLGFPGHAVAAVLHQPGPRAAEFLRCVTSWGGNVIAFDADRHDRLAAASQALTHASVLSFGLALAELDVDLAELSAIAPPPHRLLLALLARITSGSPEVYWDVQAGNPHGAAARAALCRGAETFAAMGDPQEFDAALARLRAFLGNQRSQHAALCAALFQQLPQETP